MPPARSPQIDPALSLYPPYYTYQQPQQHLNHHLTVPQNLSSPSSQGSDTMGTPPNDNLSYSPGNSNGKRPSSSLVGAMGESSRKKARSEDSLDEHSPAADKDEPKPKTTRGSRACTVCRRLKMKCVGAEQGPPCKRCTAGSHECIFEESNRGKRSNNPRKHELLSRSLKKMEKTLDTVLKSIGNPSMVSGMVSRSPSPTSQAAQTKALLDTPSPPPQSAYPPSSSANASASPKLHSLPDNSLNPLGLLAEASLANRRAQGISSSFSARPADPDPDHKVGVASDNYFRPGPMTILPLRRLYIERQIQPEMLSFVSTEQVVALFDIFFDHLNVHCELFDREFHTPSLVCSRSPFLLTTICAISSKFYTQRPELHQQLAELAQKLAFSVPAKGYKSLEIVQAYLLLTLWGCGAVERYEYDKTWLLLGMAIRMATDLNLHRKTTMSAQDTPEGRARDKEVHNRERTWLLCFALDRSVSSQMGKPHSIKEDFVIRNALQWLKSPVGQPGDTALAASVELQRIVSRSLDFLYSGTNTPSGLQTDCDYLIVIKTIETQILAWQHEWTTARPLPTSDEVMLSQSQTTMKFYFHYYMLVVNSFGLQNAMEHSAVDIGHFFSRCYTSATAVAIVARDELASLGMLKYSPDSHFVYISYAVLSLLKLIRPEFQRFIENEQNIIDLVKDVANVLADVAVNSHHAPALYSTFLRALITARTDSPQEPEEVSSREQSDNMSHGDMAHNMHNSALFGGNPAMGMNGTNGMSDYSFASEMGPVADISTFPPTMADMPSSDEHMGMLSMENILSNGFWDSVLVPGYSDTMEGLSGGFVFGAGGSGLITPGWLPSPMPSGQNTPMRQSNMDYAQQNLVSVFQQRK
ncbi:fungal-specific transcription factor domain-containing protein [Suillus fuscotomentosus]|uniref:Fungal-specific transcription factor domain-containing protein n=1 Tax=Suillus fuscotomentosus TaxID=1912939 RepID=A0AAD4DT47_9AGAM|nr:fungal-specific transcription factor domain-containing protein [Suillus fuscotomentosus]KAG1893272.1 fungal-specific transcription factor domain-containing protein [Suillus fuscotomentosus]